MLDPDIIPGWLLLCSFPAVLAFAMLCWHFIEHPALRQKASAIYCAAPSSGSPPFSSSAPRPSRKKARAASNQKEPGLPGCGRPGSNP
jgi:peptidoglycan/LPS O-acetylase OafA/YrhL